MAPNPSTPQKRALFQQLLALELQPDAPAEQFVALATEAIKRSEPLIAFDVTSVALERYPGHKRLLQKRVEAYVRAGSIERAREILEELRRNSAHDDEETLGFFGRIDKQLYWTHRDKADAPRYLRLALDGYLDAFRRTRGYWTGINAATLAACDGQIELAGKLAREVEQLCTPLLAKTTDQREQYFLLATLGEAALVLRDESTAEQWYRQAAVAAGRNYGDIASTRRNLRMLLRSRGESDQIVTDWLPIPRVIVFTGHMLDRPDRPTPRFPASLVDAVAAQIKSRVNKAGVSYAFASAACGSDLLFLQAAIDAGADVQVVLPFSREDFFKSSVEFAGEPYAKLFWNMVDESSDRVRVTQLSTKPSMNVYKDFEYANRILYGLARVRSLELGTELSAMCVWNIQPGDGAGGTADAVNAWRAAGLKPEIIDLQMIAKAKGISSPPSSAPAPQTIAAPPAPTRLAAMLFADAKGFSKLPDDRMLPFVEQYLGLLRKMLDSAGIKPMLLNTWGDGLYMVFESARDAGTFALQLCDALERARSAGKLELDIRLRVALHAGPVLPCHNPATDRPDVIGTHVTRAARLEPVTPTGQVYSTEAFAALAYAEHVDAFRCDYVGPTALDKKYGTVRAYHVRWWK